MSMSEPVLNQNDDHGPADPLPPADWPEGDVAALEKALADPLPTFVRDCQAEIDRPKCKECGELLGERFVVDHGVTYCSNCASIGAE